MLLEQQHLCAFMDPACIACLVDILQEGDYKHIFIPGCGAVFDLNIYFLCHHVQLVCHIFVTSGRLVEESEIFSIRRCGETVIPRFNQVEVGYIQFSFWFQNALPQRFTGHYFIPWLSLGSVIF